MRDEKTIKQLQKKMETIQKDTGHSHYIEGVIDALKWVTK